MHRVTCDCGNTLYFGEEEEVRVCERCGQKVAASGEAAEDQRSPADRVRRPSDAAVASPGRDLAAPPYAAAEADAAGAAAELAGRRPGVVGLCVRILRRLLRRIFSLPTLVVALVAAAVWDYRLYPSQKLPCGHVSKERFVFGLVEIRHGCEAMSALRYLDRARRGIRKELKRGGDVHPILLVVQALPGVGNPAAGIRYKFTVEKDLSLAADPSAPDSDLPSFWLELDGTVRVEGADPGAKAGPGSPLAGRFDDEGSFHARGEDRSPPSGRANGGADRSPPSGRATGGADRSPE